MKNKTLYVGFTVILAVVIACAAACILTDAEKLIALALYGTVTVFICAVCGLQLFLCRREKIKTAVLLSIVKYILSIAAVLVFGCAVSLANVLLGGSPPAFIMSLLFCFVLLCSLIFETALLGGFRERLKKSFAP